MILSGVSMVFENEKSEKCGNHTLEGKPQGKVQDESKSELCGNNGFARARGDLTTNFNYGILGSLVC